MCRKECYKGVVWVLEGMLEGCYKGFIKSVMKVFYNVYNMYFE